MQLVVHPDGCVHCVYGEQMQLSSLGLVSISRASHVEPTQEGLWFADLSPVGGPRLDGFRRRSEALDAERRWLESKLAKHLL